jgi:hypothetical protein
MMAIEDGGAMKKEPITMQTDTQPVDLRDWGYAPGYYSIKCRDCTEAGLRDCAAKHSWRCKDCATKAWEASLIAAKSTAAQPVDIVQCLRDFEGSDALGNGDFSICRAAATEIEALRARCKAMENALLGLIRWSRDEVESQIGRECKSPDLPGEWHRASAALRDAK